MLRVVRRSLWSRRAAVVAVVVAVLAVVERSVPGVLAGLGGAVVGGLGGIMVLQLALLGAAVVCGVRVHQCVLGVGTRLWERQLGRCTVAVRAVPITVGVSVGPGRRPVRRWLWAAGLLTALVGVGVAAGVGWWAVAAGGRFRHGLAIGVAGSVLAALRPTRGPAGTSTGWLLFGVPRLTGRPARELDAAPMVDTAIDAINSGDLTTAGTAAAALADRYPDLRSATYTRVSVLEAHGRYAEALPLLLNLLTPPTDTNAPATEDPDPKDAATVLAGLAGLAAAAVEAGQLDAGTGLPIAHRAVADLTELGYPPHKLTGTRALLTLLDGVPDRAAELATSAAATGDHRLTRADDLATLARARMATGDNRAARAALAEAETLAAWWPRVAAARATLDLA